MNPFDYINDILKDKKNLIVDDLTEKGYNPFMVNRGLSYYRDCIEFSNLMNRNYNLDKKLQNDFLLNIVRSQKRKFAKWSKPSNEESLECIKLYYGYSNEKARIALDILTEEQIDIIKDNVQTGGFIK